MMMTQTVAPPRTLAPQVSRNDERDQMAVAEWEATWQDWSEENFQRPVRAERARNRRNHRRESWK